MSEIRIYIGSLPSGRVTLPTRRPRFIAGEPLEVAADEAALLDENPEWKSPPKPRKPRPTPDPKGDEPDTQEPTP